MKKHIRRGLLLGILALLLVPSLVLAAIAPPDSGPFITNVEVYRYVLSNTEQDMLLIAHYNVPYATPPTEVITQTFFVYLLDDADVEVGRTSIYSYYNRGYGEGIFSIYLPAGTITWEEACSLTLQGSPTLDWGGAVPSATTTSFTWHATTAIGATKLLLYSHIIDEAETLGDTWAVALTSSAASGTKLSTYGQTYFTNAIPGLRTACSILFSSSITTPTYIDQEPNTTESDAVSADWPFDFHGLSVWLGINEMAGSDLIFHTLLGFGILGLIAFIMIRQGAPMPIALLVSFAMLWVLVIPDFIAPVIAAGITFAIVILVGIVFFLRLV